MDLKKTGRLIEKKRKALGLTQPQLSELLYVTPQAVSNWERGERYPGPSAQVMLFKVLGLNPVELLVGNEMFDDDLKKSIGSYMNRIDEKVFVSGTFIDDEGNELFLDMTGYSVVTTDRKGNPSGRWIPFKEYYNIGDDE